MDVGRTRDDVADVADDADAGVAEQGDIRIRSAW
jgi:hypothetical protein